jgi:uncharacterized sporulation protein YeaH/YhbH (DUF444 family)
MSIKEDHNRFRDIVRGKIKEDFKRFVSQGEMIGKRKKTLSKFRLPHIDIPTFRYGAKQQGGVGQGEGQPGDGTGEPGDGQGSSW